MYATDILLVLLTLLLLPAMAALAFAFFSGALERSEDVKYVALADRREWGEPGVRREPEAWNESRDDNVASREGRGWGS